MSIQVSPSIIPLQLIAVTHRLLSTRDVDAELAHLIGKLPADLQARLQPERLRGIIQPKRRYLMLQEVNGARMLAISAGESEAMAASMWLGGLPTPVPQVYDLMARLVERGGRRVEQAIIDDVSSDGLMAAIVLATPNDSAGDKTETIPCRPADAVNLAIRLGVPIGTTEAVLLFAGYVPDARTGELVRIVADLSLPDLPPRLAMPKPASASGERGPRSVEDLLGRIARGEVIVVDQPDGFILVPVPPGCVVEAEAIRLMGSRSRLSAAIQRGLVRPRFTALGDRRAGPFFPRDELDRLRSERLEP